MNAETEPASANAPVDPVVKSMNAFTAAFQSAVADATEPVRKVYEAANALAEAAVHCREYTLQECIEIADDGERELLALTAEKEVSAEAAAAAIDGIVSRTLKSYRKAYETAVVLEEVADEALQHAQNVLELDAERSTRKAIRKHRRDANAALDAQAAEREAV